MTLQKTAYMLSLTCLHTLYSLQCSNISAEVKSVSIDVSKEEVLVESALTSAEVQALIESTGRRAVLKGIGGSEQGENLRKAKLQTEE